MELEKWDKRFFDLAKTIATWSKDPEAQVGAVIISPCKKHISYGYNGFPSKIKDDNRLMLPIKNDYIVHAEINAIINTQTNLNGWTLYCSKFPCPHCALAIIQSGITKVVAPQLIPTSKWFEQQLFAINLLMEAKIEIIEARL